MEKQKFVQKEWYENKPLVEGNEIIRISTLTYIKKLKDLLPIQNVTLSLNCGCGNGGQKDIFGPSIGMDISFENIRSFIKAGWLRASPIWNFFHLEIRHLTSYTDL